MSDTVDIDVEIVCTTDLAVLIDDGDRQVWVPGSLVKNPDWEEIEDLTGKTITMTIAEWFAIKKELV